MNTELTNFMKDTSKDDYKEEEQNESSKLPSLKLNDGDLIEVTIISELVKKETKQFGTKKVLIVKNEKGEELVWWINPNNFSLVKTIKELAKANKDTLIGVKIRIMRVGKTKTDTKYSVKKI